MDLGLVNFRRYMLLLQAELGGTSSEGFGAEADTPHSGEDDLSVDDIDMYLFP